MVKWKKIEVYDDLYPWVIESEDGKWIIAEDIIGNIHLFQNKYNRKKMVKFFSCANKNSLKLAKEECIKSYSNA